MINKINLKIVSINVNSNEELISKIDIALICETKLNKKHCNLTFKNYAVVRHDRENAILGGGTAIVIKQNIKFESLNIQSLRNFECLETCGIVIQMPAGNRVFVLSMYASARNSHRFKEELNNLFDRLKFFELNNYYILAGDINAKHTDWKNPTNNTRGVFVRKWIIDEHLKYRCRLIGSKTPTYPDGDSFLDICIADQRLHFHFNDNIDSNSNELFVNRLKVAPYDSDHNAIILNVRFEHDTPFIIPKSHEQEHYNFKKANWTRFGLRVSRLCSEIFIDDNRNLENSEIDNKIVELNTHITDAINRTVPRFKTVDSTKCYITPEIQLLQKYKSKLINRLFHIYRFDAQLYHTGPAVRTLKSQLKNVKTLITQQFKISIDNHWRNKVGAISHKDPDMYPKINR